MQQKFSKNTGPTLEDGETCETSRHRFGVRENGTLMSSVEGSPAKIFPHLTTEAGDCRETEVGCGLRSKESFAHCDNDRDWETVSP